MSSVTNSQDVTPCGEMSPKEKSGGLAYNVILKPASNKSPAPSPRPRSRQEVDILEKMEQVEARKKILDAEKLQGIAKHRLRAQEAIDRLRAAEEEIKRTAHEKFNHKQMTVEEKREQLFAADRDRLRSHLAHVEEVCQRSAMVTSDLEERLKKKYEMAEAKRKEQIDTILAKVRKHAKHIEEVCEASSTEPNTDAQRDKLFEQMEAALKRREENLQALQDRLAEHGKHIENVRQNKKEADDSLNESDITNKENVADN